MAVKSNLLTDRRNNENLGFQSCVMNVLHIPKSELMGKERVKGSSELLSQLEASKMENKRLKADVGKCRKLLLEA